MICIHCNQEHPDDFMFCPKTGAKIELKACTNEECRDYGKRILPIEAKFCPRCGKVIKEEKINRKEETANSNSNESKLDFTKAIDSINNMFNLKK